MIKPVSILLVLAAVLHSACSSETEKKDEPAGDYDPSAIQEPTTEDTEEAYEGPVAPEIGRKKLHPGPLQLEEAFVADSALHLFFPGKYTELNAEMGSYKGIWWNCAACERVPVYYNYFIQPELESWFPDSSFNTTTLLSDTVLSLPNKKYRLLSFFHTNQPDLEFTGRFMGAPTGVAVFVEKDHRFVLENFQAVLGTYGSYRTPVTPSILSLGKDRFAIEFSYGNGGPGSEYTSVMEIFIPEKGAFKKVLFDRFLNCFNTNMGEWKSELNSGENDPATGFDDLVIITSGWVDGAQIDATEDEDDLHYFDTSSDELKKKVRSALQAKEKFNFVLTRTFRYNGKEYSCVGSVTEFP